VKAGTSTAADNQDWRKKYFDSLSSLESEQRQFRAMEAVLKRLTGRLCIASLGQSPRLDDEIKKLQTAVRREASSDELEKITTALTDAINSLDQREAAPVTASIQESKAQSVSAPVAESQAGALRIPESKAELPTDAIVDDERVRAILAALLAELRRDPELTMKADALDSMLAKSMTREQLPDVLSSLTELVGQRIHRIEQAKQEIEVLLSQMVGKLDEISQFVDDQNENHNQSHAISETLNIKLVGEMQAMGESVESAGDLQQIRVQVRGRLNSIGKHLQEFRQREETLSQAIRARSDQMAARVVELEAEAKRLHEQLKDEQRLSSIDALTNIPNRLAYDKRIEEEIQRWQRFKQPTCIAAWDVDHFKRINDTYGHPVGDRVLRVVAECLAGRIRTTDFLARYGGEEFAMILTGTKIEDAVRLIDEIRVAVSKIKLHFRGTPLSLTISSGVTALQSGDSPTAAFERADKALYQAKDRGRNCCVSI
jgi:diguanylate cyclase